ncbi:glycosyltransferase family 39 protein [Flavobacteriaceae sp. LMIT009]
MKRSDVVGLMSNPFYVLVLLLFLFTAIAINPYNSYDEGLWTYIGWLYNDQGIPPYLGAVENKTPGIFFLYAIADNFGDYSTFFVRSIGVLFTLATTFFIYLIGKELSDKNSGIIAMCIFGLVVCWRVLDGFAFAQTETFMIFFSTLAFYLVVRFFGKESNLKLLFFAGVSLGMAISFKQIAVTSAMGLLLVLLFLFKDFRSYLKHTIVVGFGILIAIFFCYFILFFSGVTLYEYIDGAWAILFNSGSRIGGVQSQLSNFFKMFFLSRMVIFLPIIALFIFNRKAISRLTYIILVVWFLFDFIGANASGYYYGHQIKQLLPALALVAGILLSNLFLNQKSFKNIFFPVFVFIGLLFFPLRQLKTNFGKLISPRTQDVINTDYAIDLITKNSSPNDFIYVFGADKEAVFTLANVNRRSSSKYLHSIFITSTKEQVQVYSDLKRNIPTFIVKHQEFSNINGVYGNETATFFKMNYKLEERFGELEVFKKM